MDNSEEIFLSITDGFERKPASRSSSGNPSADRSPSDLSYAAESLGDQLKNVGFDEAAREQSETIMSVSESNGGVASASVENNREREEGRDADDWSESEVREVLYPLRPDAEDCSFYMRTGSCKFGSSCKFNHPLPRNIQIVRGDKVREKEEDADKLRLMDCKYYLRTGGCKYGETCRFSHTIPNPCLASVTELNSLGLPIRPGEIECPYYMRTGSCKYGADCKFNHPDPSTIGGTDSPSFHGTNNGGGSVGSFSPKSTFQPTWSSPRHHANGSTPFIPSILSQSREWNGYQASLYSSERSVLSPSEVYSSAETSIFSQYQHQLPAEEFPERPDQPECSYYLKTGDCKFKFNCKYHHPKNRLPKHPPFALNDKGLPLRPDQNICTLYSRYGICNYGPACRFDHSAQPPGSSQAVVVEEAPEVGVNGNESDGWN